MPDPRPGAPGIDTRYLNAAPINAIADRWISRYDRERASALADLKTALEEEPMGNTEFVYTTYIKTTPERLWQALTDPAFTPEWAEAVGVSAEVLERISRERRSKVTFELEPLGQLVKLTVVHDDFAPDSTVREMVSEGWPELLAGLKTLLETGEPLPGREIAAAS